MAPTCLLRKCKYLKTSLDQRSPSKYYLTHPSCILPWSRTQLRNHAQWQRDITNIMRRTYKIVVSMTPLKIRPIRGIVWNIGHVGIGGLGEWWRSCRCTLSSTFIMIRLDDKCSTLIECGSNCHVKSSGTGTCHEKPSLVESCTFFIYHDNMEHQNPVRSGTCFGSFWRPDAPTTDV